MHIGHLVEGPGSQAGSGTYVGDARSLAAFDVETGIVDGSVRHPLYGRRAIAMRDVHGNLFIQFNDRDVFEAFGWWPTKETEFRFDE